MWFLIAICSPIAWPISKLLDYLIGALFRFIFDEFLILLGKNEGMRVFKRTELKELVTLHGIQNFLNPGDGESNHQHHPDALSVEEINVIKGMMSEASD